jgi:methionine sulfoxide reductase heme-binding subunit
MNSDAVWYLMRGSGVTSLILLTGVVVLGILTSRKTSLPTLPRFATMTLHRSISLLAVVFLVIHVGTAVLDPYAQVRIVDLLVPFIGSWQALWLGLGTLALDALAAVVVSSLLMKHIKRRTWRTIHWLGYACWPLAFLHSIELGSDSGTLWLRAIAVLMLGTIVAAAGFRVSEPSASRSPSAAPRGGRDRAPAAVPGAPPAAARESRA